MWDVEVYIRIGISPVHDIVAFIFAVEWFLPEYGPDYDERILFNPDGLRFVRKGRLFRVDGGKDCYEYQKDPDVGPSRHFTYLFNIFVMMQLVNDFNLRKIKDEINIFGGMEKNPIFIIVWLLEFFL